MAKMGRRHFINTWLLPCSLRSHRTANSTPQNGLCHFSTLPTHHPSSEQDNYFKKSSLKKIFSRPLFISKICCTFAEVTIIN
jgi:hypothetical protein